MSHPVLVIALIVLFVFWFVSKLWKKDAVLSELKKMNSKLDRLEVIDANVKKLLGVKQDGNDNKSEQ